MGIQANLNQLSSNIWRGIAAIAGGAKTISKLGLNKKQENSQNAPQTNVTNSMGNIVEIGENPARNNFDSYFAAAKSVSVANDAIKQKAISKQPVENRLKEIKENLHQNETNKLNDYALNEFGETEDFTKGIYMLPNGKMIDGTYKGATKGRSIDHRDISSAYDENNISFKKDASASDYMLDYMKRGNIRLQPEIKSVDIISKPTKEQLNLIYKMFNDGKLEAINITNPKSEYGETLDLLKDIKSEEQISNFIRKNFFKFK